MTKEYSPDIKILVSCHKEVPLPVSDVYLPVQVGAFNKNPIKGMQLDSDGDNISKRNFSFCELTAQYWAWKNLEADFYGLCHYRRYFCFDGQEHPANDHAQIEADSLSEYTFRDYQINNDELVKTVIKDCDVVIPPYWDITKANTPSGIKKTVQEHMTAFGLYTNVDVELLRSIIKDKQPDYLECFDGYMSGDKYLGYNCFVMQKNLFNRFCEFEFDILLEFDKQFDYSNITATRKRICGYFGEVLFSVFIAKIQQEQNFRIKHIPLVFFLDTACSISFENKEDFAGNEAIQIIWRYRDRSANALEVCIESLLEHLDPEKHYELTLLYDTEFILDAFNNILSKMPPNIILRKAHWASCFIPSEMPSLSTKDLDLIQPLLLPWLNNTNSSFLWVDGLVIFQDDPAAILVDNYEKAYYCIKNALLHRELNKPQTVSFLGDYKLSPKNDEILDLTLAVINSTQAKKDYSVVQICDIVTDFRSKLRLIEPEREIGKPPTQKKKTPVASGYLLENQAFRAHILKSLNVESLPFRHATHAVDKVDTAAWLNEEWSKEWKEANNPVAIYYEYGKPPILNANQRFGAEYWKQARKSKIYEVLLGEVLEPEEDSLKEMFFPEGSRRKKLIKKILHR